MRLTRLRRQRALQPRFPPIKAVAILAAHRQCGRLDEALWADVRRNVAERKPDAPVITVVRTGGVERVRVMQGHLTGLKRCEHPVRRPIAVHRLPATDY